MLYLYWDIVSMATRRWVDDTVGCDDDHIVICVMFLGRRRLWRISLAEFGRTFQKTERLDPICKEGPEPGTGCGVPRLSRTNRGY
jgi:hypothetical protein